MAYLVSKYQSLSYQDTCDIPVAPVKVVPNGSLSSRDIFTLYSKGVDVPHLQHLREDASPVGYYPSDPLEALQLANDYVTQKSTVETSTPQSSTTTPLVSQSSSDSNSSAEIS